MAFFGLTCFADAVDRSTCGGQEHGRVAMGLQDALEGIPGAVSVFLLEGKEDISQKVVSQDTDKNVRFHATFQLVAVGS